MKKKITEINFDNLFTELFEKDEVSFILYETEVVLSLTNNPKRICLNVTKKKGDYHGRGWCTEPYLAHIRIQIEDNFKTVSGKDLPISDQPLTRIWTISTRGIDYPLEVSKFKPDLESFKISNKQTASDEDEYCFELDPTITYLLDYPTKDNLIFIPVSHVWRELSYRLPLKYFPLQYIRAFKYAQSLRGAYDYT